MSVKSTLFVAGALASTLISASHVHIPITKNGNGYTNIREKVDTEGNLQFTIENQESYYSVELVMGSDNQKLIALLDTGSSDLWILGEDDTGLNACDAYLKENGYITASGDIVSGDASEVDIVRANCEQLGVFAPGNSTTFKKEYNNIEFEIDYGDYTYADGYWGEDTLSVNGVSVDGLMFGVANVSNSSNVLGISFEGLETSDDLINGHHGFTYSNLPSILKQDGLINKKAYSLFLNALNATSGDLLFGAVDTAKYQGDMYTVPLVNIYSDVSSVPIEFDVALQGTGYVDGEGNEVTFNQQIYAAVFDSGTSFTVLPQEVADMFAKQVNATYDDDLESYVLPCGSHPQSEAFVFQFGGVNFYTPVANYIQTTSDSNTCLLNIQTFDYNYAIIGDNSLTSLYVVYDLEDYELSIAQVDLSGADENSFEDIYSTVPGAIKAPGYSSTSLVSTSASLTSGGNIFTGSQPTNPYA